VTAGVALGRRPALRMLTLALVSVVLLALVEARGGRRAHA
jgi:hypothetical protein